MPLLMSVSGVVGIELAPQPLDQLVSAYGIYRPAWSDGRSRRKALVGTLLDHKDGVKGMPRLARP